MALNSSSSLNLHVATWNFKDGGHVADFRLPSHLTEGFVTENRAQNKIEHHQIVLSYALGNEAKRNADKWRGSRKDRDGLLVARTRA